MDLLKLKINIVKVSFFREPNVARLKKRIISFGSLKPKRTIVKVSAGSFTYIQNKN